MLFHNWHFGTCQIVKQHNFNTDKFVREFGIKVREDLTLVDARVLPPPMVYMFMLKIICQIILFFQVFKLLFLLQLKYHETGGESRVDPRMGQWNMINKVIFFF